MKRVSFFLALSRVFSAATAFLTILYLARTREVSTVGDINASMSLIQVLSLALTLGLATSVVFFAKGSPANAYRLVIRAYASTAVFGVFGLPIIFIFFSDFFSVYTAAFLFSLLALFSGYLQACEKYGEYAILVVLQAVCFPLSNMISLSYQSVASFFWAYSALLASLFFFWNFWCARSVEKFSIFNFSSSDGFYSYGANSLSFNLVSALYYSADVLALKFLIGADFVGLYSVGASVAKSSWLVVDSIGQVVFPQRVSGKLSDADFKRIKLVCYGFSGLLCVFWYFFGEFILTRAFGSAYLPAFSVTLVLLIGSVFVSYYKLQSRVLAAENKWRALNLAQALGVIASVFGVWVLSDVYSYVGASVGQAFAFFLTSAFLYFLSKNNKNRGIHDLMKLK